MVDSLQAWHCMVSGSRIAAAGTPATVGRMGHRKSAAVTERTMIEVAAVATQPAAVVVMVVAAVVELHTAHQTDSIRQTMIWAEEVGWGWVDGLVREAVSRMMFEKGKSIGQAVASELKAKLEFE